MISRQLPGPPSICWSGSRTPWLSSRHWNRRTWRTATTAWAGRVWQPCPSTSTPTSTAEVLVTPSGHTAKAVAPELKQKNVMLWKSSKKHKSPMASLDAAPTVDAITHVKDTLIPPKTCNNPKNWPVIIDSNSNSDATEEWQEHTSLWTFQVRFR